MKTSVKQKGLIFLFVASDKHKLFKPSVIKPTSLWSEYLPRNTE